ncbi:hypothetical protein H6G65_08670 [Microcystis elabens FACHB-917]|nr:hypothetical protein [Microcystis elabens FACHB-917]
MSTTPGGSPGAAGDGVDGVGVVKPGEAPVVVARWWSAASLRPVQVIMLQPVPGNQPPVRLY